MKIEAARSAAWALIESVGSQSLSLCVFMVLARILVPEDYSTMSLVAVMVALPTIVINNGMVPILVQRDPLDDADCYTVFWSVLAIGVVLAGVTIAVSHPIAAALHNPLLAPALDWMSLILVISGLGVVPSAIYMRELDYSTFVVRSMVGIFGGGVVGIGLALNGWGVWALVANQLSQTVISVLVLWYGARWLPRFRFSWRSFKALRAVAWQSMLANLLIFLTLRIDVLIIGIFAPAAATLGIYYFVTRLMFILSTVTQVPINMVLIPVLRHVKNEPNRLRQVFLSMLWATQAFWTPLAAGLGIVSPTLIPLLFGAHWSPAVPVLQLASLTAFTAVLSLHTYCILYTAERLPTFIRLSVVQIVLVAGTYAMAARNGLVAIGIAYAGLSLVVGILHLQVVSRALGMSARSVIVRLSGVAAAGAVMVGAVAALQAAAPGAGALMLLVEIPVGALVYIATLVLLARSDVYELVTTFFEMLGRRPTALFTRAG